MENNILRTSIVFLIVSIGCVSGQYKNCQAIKDAGFTTNGRFTIDIDETGSLTSFIVYCDFTSSSTAVTIMNHDSEARTQITGFDSAGEYIDSIAYEVSMTQIAAVVSDSASCQQHLKYECLHSALGLSDSSPYAWWVDRSGAQQTYWGGATGLDGKCACGVGGTCASDLTTSATLTCNCDANDATWRIDEGYLEDKSVLPVTMLRFGDTGQSAEEGYVTLGPLLCYAATPTPWVQTAAGIVVIIICILIFIGIVIMLNFCLCAPWWRGVCTRYCGCCKCCDACLCCDGPSVGQVQKVKVEPTKKLTKSVSFVNEKKPPPAITYPKQKAPAQEVLVVDAPPPKKSFFIQDKNSTDWEELEKEKKQSNFVADGQAVDPATGRSYAYNSKTGQRKWLDTATAVVAANRLRNAGRQRDATNTVSPTTNTVSPTTNTVPTTQ
ncbi:uncharacterized protein [Branchiostoma lanceolatum]|uniref:uncharacterized protein isoform X2 n=1 Tax=Branchiostoma lanceolatum TaxID=7740 RepID=UPI003451EABA